MKNRILERAEGTVRIELTKGKSVLIDETSLPLIDKYHWHYNLRGYAVTNPGTRKEKELILMHRLINQTPVGMQTDHINRNKLDNRKSNLRTVTIAENLQNVGITAKNTSGYKGVSYSKNNRNWEMQISKAGKKISRRFATKEEAALEYNKYALKLFGNFAYLNKVEVS